MDICKSEKRYDVNSVYTFIKYPEALKRLLMKLGIELKLVTMENDDFHITVLVMHQ